MLAKSTKQRLLESGLKLFSEHGLNGTSTRMISKKAGVNIAAIGYYYGGKEPLYEAVVINLINEFKQLISPACIEANTEIDIADHKKAKAILLKFLIRISKVSHDPKLVIFTQIIAREQIHPSESFQIIFKNFTSIIFEIITKCLKRIIPNNTENYYSVLSQSFISLATLFMIFKANILTCLNVDAFSNEHYKAHKEIIEQRINALNDSVKIEHQENPAMHVNNHSDLVL